MSKTTPDYSGVMSLLPLNWEADEDAFQYLLDGAIRRIVGEMERDGTPIDVASISALHDAAWAYRSRVLEPFAGPAVQLIPVNVPFGGKP